jgi:1,4-dihydroxy-2-naphthoyl-CoA hydrolase
MPTSSQRFERYDPKIAAAMIRTNETVGGLPAFLGAKLLEYGPGRLVAALEVRDDLVTPMGALHGGVMAGFVDHVLGCVLYPLMEPGQWAATTEFKLNYLAAVKSGTLRAESTVISLGKRAAVVRVEVTNADRLVCVAQGTLLVSDPPAARKPA